MKFNKYIYAVILGALVVTSNILAAVIHNPNYKFANSAAIDEFSIYTMIMLLLSGIIVGYVSNLSILFYFITTIFSMSILTFVELVCNKYLHNLLPFEIITGYPYVAMYVVIGVYVSRFLRK